MLFIQFWVIGSLVTFLIIVNYSRYFEKSEIKYWELVDILGLIFVLIIFPIGLCIIIYCMIPHIWKFLVKTR